MGGEHARADVGMAPGLEFGARGTEWQLKEGSGSGNCNIRRGAEGNY